MWQFDWERHLDGKGVRRLGLCFVCLNGNHLAGECSIGTRYNVVGPGDQLHQLLHMNTQRLMNELR